MHGYTVVAIVGLVLTTSSAFAEDRPIADAIARAFSVGGTVNAQSTDVAKPVRAEGRFRHRRRPWPLPILYGSSAFLQSFDAYVTLTALEAGASEANPLMEPVIGRSPVAFIAVKAGLTVASIVAAEKLWKDHHRKSAVALMVFSNAIMVAVAAHNSSVVQQVK